MKSAPYGSSYGIESEDTFARRDPGDMMNPERSHRLPNITIRSNKQSADSDYDETSGGNNFGRIKQSHHSYERGNASHEPSPIPDWRRNIAEMKSQMRSNRGNGEGYGYLNSKYQEGPLNYFDDSSHGRAPSHYNEFIVPKSFEYLERDRAELLRKLSELEDQLVRSGSVGEQRKPRDPFERNMYGHESYGSSNNWFQDNSSISSSSSYMADKPGTKPSYHSHYPEKHSYTERHDAAVRNSYLSTSIPNEIVRNGTYSDPQMPRRAPTHPSGQCHQYFSHTTSSHMQYIDAADPHTFRSYHSPLHQPDCSCIYCYNNRRKSFPLVQSGDSENSRFTETPSNPKFYHQSGAPVFGQPGYSSPKSNPSLGIGDRRTHTRWPTEVDSNFGNPVESMVPAKVRSNIRLIAGGAPFLTCRNCFELLKLPQKIVRVDNQQQKIRCGACSYYMYCTVKGKSLHVSVNEGMKEKSKEREYGSNIEEVNGSLKASEHVSNEVVEEIIHARGPSRTSKSFQSDDFDNAVYEEGKKEAEEVEQDSNSALEETKEDPKVLVYSSIKATENYGPTSQAIESFQSDGCPRDESQLVDKQPNSVASLASNSNKSLGAQSLLSAASSEDNDVEGCLTTQGEVADDADNGSKLSHLSGGLDQEEQHGYSPSDHAVYWFGTRSQIRRAKYEAKFSEKSTSHKKLAKEVATETNLSYNETADTDISLDSKSGKRDEIPQRPTMDDNGGSFLAGNMKNKPMEFGKLSQAVEGVNWNVSINDHPIPDNLVKKAEDLAGPVQPGSYWYDFHAGFWGVMGGPCLGIIPPHIKEFDYPISKNCSGGTTGVIVNGRELHKKDLALLESRGLPADRDKSYILELSGRIIDKDSGKELTCLGPLAPTIARLKRGFGMRSSRHLRQEQVDGS